MFPKLDLEGIVFRLEDPFHGLQVDLATLKGSNLTGLADVQQYARRVKLPIAAELRGFRLKI